MLCCLLVYCCQNRWKYHDKNYLKNSSPIQVTNVKGFAMFLNLSEFEDKLPDIDLDMILYANERTGLDDENWDKYSVSRLKKKYPNATKKIVSVVIIKFVFATVVLYIEKT